ncbi:hypothetical protein JOL79_06680 [Microbispora sp. RL4-1S]|uniref:Uncharacterized protein n=1 Tax=Microbispora oryzae TaxID=2806554 RepID=A0A941AI61_9ACTN|nr:hypothetical protein [Microbispora oryzae]MBP2703482.1 hypothetical protein [Microbispora oryzae]
MITAEDLTAMIEAALERSSDAEVSDEAVVRAVQIWSGCGRQDTGGVVLPPHP